MAFPQHNSLKRSESGMIVWPVYLWTHLTQFHAKLIIHKGPLSVEVSWRIRNLASFRSKSLWAFLSGGVAEWLRRSVSKENWEPCVWFLPSSKSSMQRSIYSERIISNLQFVFMSRALIYGSEGVHEIRMCPSHGADTDIWNEIASENAVTTIVNSFVDFF